MRRQSSNGDMSLLPHSSLPAVICPQYSQIECGSSGRQHNQDCRIHEREGKKLWHFQIKYEAANNEGIMDASDRHYSCS